MFNYILYKQALWRSHKVVTLNKIFRNIGPLTVELTRFSAEHFTIKDYSLKHIVAQWYLLVQCFDSEMVASIPLLLCRDFEIVVFFKHFRCGTPHQKTGTTNKQDCFHGLVN